MLANFLYTIVEVPFDAHPALARIPEADRSKFIVSDDGSLITWDTDPYPTDLDLSALRYAADPAFRENVDRERQLRGAAYGHGIRAFREEKGIRQSDIAGLSERQVRRIEREGTTSENALKALAAAHKLALGDYLNELAERAQNK